MAKFITSCAAAQLVVSGWTITTGGFGSCGHPEAVTAALQERFAREHLPTNLTLVFSAGQGDKGDCGINRLGKPGLLARVIGGYWALAPRLGELAKIGVIEAYNWPQGVISQMFRAVAAGAPGIISGVGLHTFIDPRQDGGRLNEVSCADLIKLVRLDSQEFLHYPSIPIDCAIIRGTSADAKGNISMEREANFHDALAQAMAAHNSGGIVIVQVERLSPSAIPAHQVRVPGIVVDYVVLAPPELHWQTYGEQFDPAFVGASLARERPLPILPMGPKKIIARRALLELLDMGSAVVNLGIGTPEFIATVAAEERADGFTLTVESGAIGGYPAGGMSFGATVTPEAVIEQPSLFDFYDGGGIDIAFLGNAQTDSTGNVNVSRFGNRLYGVGGFVNISRAAKNLVFCGTFTTGGLAVEAENGRLRILNEGHIRKYLPRVEHVSFNAADSERRAKKVLYITERGVFRLVDGRLILTEVAPGIDPIRDVVKQAGADICIADDLAEMDARIFNTAPMTAHRPSRQGFHYIPSSRSLQ
jgi:propionate CoA-transferase